jgi:pimeloyl-ACP methyl ester carboxylesterase
MNTNIGLDEGPHTDAIRPFRLDVPQADVDDLQERLARVRWPAILPGGGWERGVPLDYLRGLAEYWRAGYDWRRHESQLNELPQFTTKIDGQTVHFLHVRSPEPDALPLVVTHGYPSAYPEVLGIVGPLTDPRSHGGDPADAFHLVVPSLPGYGCSTPLAGAGWELDRTAAAWVELMARLGYTRYGAHGYDIGAGVSGALGAQDPEAVVGAHVTTDPTALALIGGMLPDESDDMTDAQKRRLADYRRWEADGRGYLQIQSTRPQTLAYGLADSPVAQLAWIVEKFQEWTSPAAALPEDAVDRDQLLTIVSLYWFTGTGPTAANFIYEASHAERDWSAVSPAPTGMAVFAADDLLRYVLNPGGQIAHWSEFEQGGHFPAMEVPDLLVGDIRAFFRPLRGAQTSSR